MAALLHVWLPPGVLVGSGVVVAVAVLLGPGVPVGVRVPVAVTVAVGVKLASGVLIGQPALRRRRPHPFSDPPSRLAWSVSWSVQVPALDSPANVARLPDGR